MGKGRIVLGISGGSGIAYAVGLLRHYPGETLLILSEDAKKVLPVETDLTPRDLEERATRSYRNDDYLALPASGSARFDGMVVVPCSMSTLAKIALGISDNLITRAAAVCLKERRKLILVPRETPLSEVHLDNMLRVTRAGAIVLPAMPGFYQQPKTVDDLVDFVVARILDHLEVEHDLGPRWGEKG